MFNNRMILPSSFFAPIFQYALISQSENYLLETKEHFVKQSYRSRFEIYAANGKLSSVVPLKKWKNHTPIENIEITYEDKWQTLHWRSIESAYRTSPYFEFYEEDVKPLFFLKTSKLTEYNQKVEEGIKAILNLNKPSQSTIEYTATKPDWRKIIHPKNEKLEQDVTFPKYIQVFESKFGFIPNLSILDLLFNLGPDSKKYLESIRFEKWQKQ